jgi:hypothetical protein
VKPSPKHLSHGVKISITTDKKYYQPLICNIFNNIQPSSFSCQNVSATMVATLWVGEIPTMTSTSQRNANRENAQKSTGATTPAGAERSSKNATKHGLTGQILVVSPEEREAYESHVQHYMDHHKPTTQQHRQLVQQLADSHWSIHQVFVLQSNAMALINAITIQKAEEGDPLACAAALAPLTRQLNTYSIYESRKRRAAHEIQQELDILEQERAEQLRNTAPIPNKPKQEPEVGFVYSGRGPLLSPKDFERMAEAYVAANPEP